MWMQAVVLHDVEGMRIEVQLILTHLSMSMMDGLVMAVQYA